jgi:hypothetical protein
MYCFIATRVLVRTSFMCQSFSMFECNLNWLAVPNEQISLLQNKNNLSLSLMMMSYDKFSNIIYRLEMNLPIIYSLWTN